MSVITPQNCWLGWRRESTNCQGSSFRDDAAALGDHTNTPFYALDTWEEGLDFPASMPDYEILYAGGSRDPTHQNLISIPPGDGTLPTKVQYGYWWYYVLGAVTNTLAAAVWTHTMTPADTLPSLAFHLRQKDNVHEVDHYGCIAKSLTFSGAKDGSFDHELGLIVAKSLNVATTSTITKPAFVTQATTRDYVWSDIDEGQLSFTIGGTPVFNDSGDVWYKYIENISIGMENEITIDPPGGDTHGETVTIGKRTWTISMHCKLIDATLWDLVQQTEFPYSEGDLDMVFRVSRDKTNDDDYIEWTFDKLFISGYSPHRVPSVSDMKLGVDIELTLGAGGTCTSVEEKNPIDESRYDGVDDT